MVVRKPTYKKWWLDLQGYESTFASYYLLPFPSRFPTSEGHTSLAILRENVTFLGWWVKTWPEINGCKSDKTPTFGDQKVALFESPGPWFYPGQKSKNPQKARKTWVKPTWGFNQGLFRGVNNYLEPETSIYKWLFQLDDSTSLLGKWLFHQTSIRNWLFRVPGK